MLKSIFWAFLDPNEPFSGLDQTFFLYILVYTNNFCFVTFLFLFYFGAILSICMPFWSNNFFWDFAPFGLITQNMLICFLRHLLTRCFFYWNPRPNRACCTRLNKACLTCLLFTNFASCPTKIT